VLKDSHGLAVTAAGSKAVEALDATVAAYCGLRTDTGERLKEALTADPNLVMAHILRGNFMMLFGKRPFLARALQSLEAAEAAIGAVGANPRERLHLEALRAWAKGDLPAAIARWEAVLIDHPRDIVALKLAQYHTFYTGDSAGMRDSLGRVLYAWDEGVPGYGFVLGCYAFGLEESGDYAAAERAGRRAIELNREDVWAAHAVAHVLEMQGRPREGVAWVDGLDDAWGAINNFVFHIRWHRCLFHLELEQYDRVLERYDREVRAESTDEYLDITNAVAMLWRLEQAGVDVGRRWVELAERSAVRGEDHMMVFADVHYPIALAAAGAPEGAERWLQSSRRFAASDEGTQARVMRDVGLALGEAAIAHRRRAWGRVVELLLPLRPAIREIGGSHAQRDLFQQMLIDAVLKDGRITLARSLLSERTHLRPRNAWGWTHAAKAAEAMGEPDVAMAAREEAKRLLAA
jgi:tetratricopeptide (TPR) repeat protein